MVVTEREGIIRNYIDGYNEGDIQKMVADLDDSIIFKDFANGELTLALNGLAAFKEQAEKAKTWFSERMQTIKSIRHGKDEVEVDIDYHAVLAIDLPNGFKKGHRLQLHGKSIFTFRGTKIIALQDMS